MVRSSCCYCFDGHNKSTTVSMVAPRLTPPTSRTTFPLCPCPSKRTRTMTMTMTMTMEQNRHHQHHQHHLASLLVSCRCSGCCRCRCCFCCCCCCAVSSFFGTYTKKFRVCVCVCERERESVCVKVKVRVCEYLSLLLTLLPTAGMRKKGELCAWLRVCSVRRMKIIPKSINLAWQATVVGCNTTVAGVRHTTLLLSSL